MKSKIISVITVAGLLFLSGCGGQMEQEAPDNMSQEETYAQEESVPEELSEELTGQLPEENIEEDAEWEIPELDDASAEEAAAPVQEEVLAMRELVLEGMSQEEIERLTENIKVANLQMEEAYLYDALFEKLENAEHLYWNYFDRKGDIQIDDQSTTVYNRFDAENFAALLEEMKETVHNEKLQSDLQTIIDETRLAAETHEVEHVVTIYKMLHDMDYYLLRYGLKDVGIYVRDVSTIAKYYGVLSVYN